jgi:F-type H+-transporting ATPase subunit b
MELDLFTFVAQVVNFVVLVVLLRIFLYKPVIRAMDERERRIASRLEDAEQEQRRAEEAAGSYRQKQKELEKQHGQILAEARSEAEKRKSELLEEARREAEETREKWSRALERQRESFLSRLRTRVGEETYRIARKALRDLADEALEARIVVVFARRLDQLPKERRRELARALEHSGHVRVQSAFALENGDRARLEERIRALVDGKLSFDYWESGELISGIELRTGDERVSFSLESYLDELEERMREAVEEESEKKLHA